MVLAGIGVALIVIGWGGLASETVVALQLPYVVSGAVVGLALVMIGLTLATIQTKRRDAAVDASKLEELAALLNKLGDR